MKIFNNITHKLILTTIFFTPLYLIRFKIFDIPTNILELLIYATFFAWLTEKKYLFLKNIFYQNKYILVSSSLIIIGLFISTIANQNYREGLGIIKGWFVDPMLIAIIVLTTVRSTADAKNTLSSLFWSGFTVSLISITYAIGGQLTYDGRLRAFYLSPNHLAMFLVPPFIIGIFSVFSENKSTLSPFRFFNQFKLSAILCIATALYFTQSYAAIISIIGSMFIIKLVKKDHRKNITPLIIIFSLITVFFIAIQIHTEKFQTMLNFDRSSIASRMMIWKSAGKMLADHPIFGIGTGNFQSTYLDYQKYFPPYLEWAVPQPHNLFLAFWLESGIIGFWGFIYLLYKWIRKIIYNLRQKNNRQFILIPLLTIIFSLLIHGLVDTTYWKNDLAVVFWVIIALGISTDYFKD